MADRTLAVRVIISVTVGAIAYIGSIVLFGGWHMVETLLGMLRQLRSRNVEPAAEPSSAAG
jgi:hypothetical protein